MEKSFSTKDVMSTSKSVAIPSETAHMVSGTVESAFGSATLGGLGARSSRATGSQLYSGGSFHNYVADHLHRMHREIENTTRKLELERRRLHSLDEAHQGASSEYANKREKYKIWQSSEDCDVTKAQQKLHKLESRLGKSISELNKGESENIALREKIDELRKVRLHKLDPQFKQLTRDITSASAQLSRLHKVSHDSKAEHGEATQRGSALRKKLDVERAEFKNQCGQAHAELQEQDRIQREMQLKAALKNKCKDSSYMVADEEEDFNETAIERRILKLSFLNAIQRRHIKQHQKNIEVFEQAFATIKSSTGISDIEEIVKIFVKLEERNFSLLTYVNQLNREIESIELRNCALGKQLKEHNEQEEQAAVRKRVALSDLANQIKKTQTAADDKTRSIEEGALALAECRPLIWGLVSSVQSTLSKLSDLGRNGDREPLVADLVSSPDEHEENINNWLTYIEDCMLQFKTCIPSTDLSQVARPQAKRPDRNLVVRPNEIPSAQLHADSEDDEDGGDPMGQMPLNRSELKVTVERLLMKRRNRNRHKADADRRQLDESGTSQLQPEKSSPKHVDDESTDAPDISDRSKLNWRKEGPVTGESSRSMKKEK